MCIIIWNCLQMQMRKLTKRLLIFLLCVTSVFTKEAELPLCPTNVQFFPQNLPMHCRMPVNTMLPGIPQFVEGRSLPTTPPVLPPFYQSPPPETPGIPMPLIVPPGIPGPLPFGGPGSMPMMPMLPPVPPHKLPVIVMPFYSPDPIFKKSSQYSNSKHKGLKKKHNMHRRPHYDSVFDTDISTDTDSSSDTSRDTSTDREWWRKRIPRNKNTRKFNRNYKSKKMKRNRKDKKELLTPLLQYVTKDGYVIYEKEISKGEARDWLDAKNDDGKYKNKEEDTRLNDYNLNEGREPKVSELNLNVSREDEKTKHIQKFHSKRKQTRNINNEKMKTP